MGPEDHERAQPDVGIEPKRHDRRDGERKEQVRRECRQELGDGLDEAGEPRAQADPDADRHPDQAGDRDERQHAHHRDQAEKRRGTHLGGRQSAEDEAADLPECRRGHGENDAGPQAITPARVVPTDRDLGMPWAAAKLQPVGAPPQEREGSGQGRNDTGMAEDVQDPGLGWRDSCFLLEPEAIRPGNQRSEEQLVVDQDDHEHRADRPPDRGEVLPLDGQGDVRAHARQRDRGVADSDRLRGDDEEPAARHRHHHVPNELRHRERHLDTPEAHPCPRRRRSRRRSRPRRVRRS